MKILPVGVELFYVDGWTDGGSEYDIADSRFILFYTFIRSSLMLSFNISLMISNGVLPRGFPNVKFYRIFLVYTLVHCWFVATYM